MRLGGKCGGKIAAIGRTPSKLAVSTTAVGQAEDQPPGSPANDNSHQSHAKFPRLTRRKRSKRSASPGDMDSLIRQESPMDVVDSADQHDEEGEGSRGFSWTELVVIRSLQVDRRMSRWRRRRQCPCRWLIQQRA